MRTKGGVVQAINVAAEYTLWGGDVRRNRTEILSNEDEEIYRIWCRGGWWRQTETPLGLSKFLHQFLEKADMRITLD